MATSRSYISKAWKLVTKNDLVELGGKLYTVKAIGEVKKGKRKVTVRDTESGAEFSAKMPAKEGVETIELVKRKVKKWTKPDDQAEKNIVEGLDAKLVGVKPSDDEMWVCPPVDVTTIAGHLYIFHGITGVDVRKEGGYQEAIDIHDTEHAKPIGSLHEPHIHEADRPVVEIGPRFT